METKKALEISKDFLKDLMSKLDELDSNTLDNTLKEYCSNLKDVLEDKGMSGRLIDAIVTRFSDEFNSYRSDYSRKRKRDENSNSYNETVKGKEEELEQNASEENKNMGHKLLNEAGMEGKLEVDESLKNMEFCTREILQRSNGYLLKTMSDFDIMNGRMLEEFQYDIGEFARGLSDKQLSDYRLNLAIIEQKFDDEVQRLADKIGKKEMGEKGLNDVLGIDANDVYNKYRNGEYNYELNLGPEELGIKLCGVKRPVLDEQNKVLEKGVLMSKSILDEAQRDGNMDLLKPKGEGKYEIIEGANFYQVLTVEEVERVSGHSKAKEANKGKAEEKPTEKEAYEYEGFL